MPQFVHAHATHPDWRIALALVAAQLDAQRHGAAGLQAPKAPTLGWVYITEAYAFDAELLLSQLRLRWPGTAWVGAVGVGICATGCEYFEEPALSIMLCDLPSTQFRVFSGAKPLSRFRATSAQVHADPQTSDLAELLSEMAERTESRYLFGGVSSGRGQEGHTRGQAAHIADGVFTGGLSGVAFGPQVGLVSRVTQGCQPVGATRTITEAEHNLVLALDGEPALDVLLRDLSMQSLNEPQALPLFRQTLVGLEDGDHREPTKPRPGPFGADTRVRHLVGIDPSRRGVAIADRAVTGQRLAFCRRNREAAQQDLVRICTEIRDELEPETLTLTPAHAQQGPEALAAAVAAAPRMAGAIYISCAGRGGPHFGAAHAELAVVRRALGDVPLVGFFAAGEVGRHHLYGYTGVLTVFTR
jgi:small ligand-binding sensory domain FIST